MGHRGAPPRRLRDTSWSSRLRLESRRYGARVSATPPPIAAWRGQPSGDVFARLVRARADQLGLPVRVEVLPWKLTGSYGITVDWDAGDVMYEVADWLDGARVLDPGDHDLSVDQALDYLSARMSGLDSEQAILRVAPPARSLWSRLRKRLGE